MIAIKGAVKLLHVLTRAHSDSFAPGLRGSGSADLADLLHPKKASVVATYQSERREQTRTICVRAVKVTEHHVLGVCRWRVSDLGLTDVTPSRWRSRRCERVP